MYSVVLVACVVHVVCWAKKLYEASVPKGSLKWLIVNPVSTNNSRYWAKHFEQFFITEIMARYLWYLQIKSITREQGIRLLVKLWYTAVVVLGVTVPCVLLVMSLENAYERRIWHRDCADPPVANSVDRLLSDKAAVASGREEFLAPNYVHLYRFGEASLRLSTMDLFCLLAVLQHQSPDQLFIHTDNVQAVRESFAKSSYGSRLWSMPQFQKLLRLLYYPLPEHVFGLPLSVEHKEKHISDLVRLRILRKYGGIFMDNNVYLDKDVQLLRQSELAVVVASDFSIDNCLMVAHRDSRVLKAWLTSYVQYSTHLPHHHHSPRVDELVKHAHGSMVDLVPDAALNASIKQFLSMSSSFHPHYIIRLNSWSKEDELFGISRLDSELPLIE